MYPGPDAPDLGTFVAQVERELVARGPRGRARRARHARAAGSSATSTLARTGARARRDARRRLRALPRPDRPDRRARRRARRSSSPRTGATSATSARFRGIARRDARSSCGARRRVICVSDYLRRELETKLPEARGKTEVVSSGVDLERFAVAAGAATGRRGFLCVGALDERKNVVRLADAFARLGEGTLTFAGDGPLRAAARRARRASRLARRASRTTRSRACSPTSHVALPAEPDRAARPGAARGDGLRPLGRRDADRRPAGVRPARGGRARRPARRRRARRARSQPAAALPCPNEAAREAAADARRPPSGGADRGDPQPGGRSQVREPDLDERPDRSPRAPPRARAASACSQLSRAFSGSTPCFSRLSPVTSSFWIRSRASSPPQVDA